MDQQMGICYICKNECNICSQTCGRCIRDITTYEFGLTHEKPFNYEIFKNNGKRLQKYKMKKYVKKYKKEN